MNFHYDKLCFHLNEMHISSLDTCVDSFSHSVHGAATRGGDHLPYGQGGGEGSDPPCQAETDQDGGTLCSDPEAV